MSYETEYLQNIIEGALLAVGGALSIDRILALFEENEAPEKELVLEALRAIQEKCSGRGFELVEVASGWRFQVRAELATWVNRLWEEKPQKYTRSLLETLSLIAYRQPLTRGDIEEVRGVSVSSHTIKTLAEREWIKVVGHRDVPGRPALYATTRQFLDYFGLKSLDELPTLGDLRDIDELNASLDFSEEPSPDDTNAQPVEKMLDEIGSAPEAAAPETIASETTAASETSVPAISSVDGSDASEPPRQEEVQTKDEGAGGERVKLTEIERDRTEVDELNAEAQ